MFFLAERPKRSFPARLTRQLLCSLLHTSTERKEQRHIISIYSAPPSHFYTDIVDEDDPGAYVCEREKKGYEKTGEEGVSGNLETT